MSEEKKERNEKSYREIIRARAKSSSGLRTTVEEKKEPRESLRQKVELAKKEKKSD